MITTLTFTLFIITIAGQFVIKIRARNGYDCQYHQRFNKFNHGTPLLYGKNTQPIIKDTINTIFFQHFYESLLSARGKNREGESISFHPGLKPGAINVTPLRGAENEKSPNFFCLDFFWLEPRGGGLLKIF
ncbi:MAG: hypothetical protein FWE57_05950 [Chitinispirillia bacterium]|nr:hypothetical protein [Chitinispirillia bacterium]